MVRATAHAKTAWVLLTLIASSACSSEPNPPVIGSTNNITTGTDAGNSTIGVPECDPLLDPCEPIARATGSCAVPGTPPDGLPQLDATIADLGLGPVVAASPDPLYALTDGRIVDGNGADVTSVAGSVIDWVSVPDAPSRLVVSHVSGGALVITDVEDTQQFELLRVPYDTSAIGGALGFGVDGALLIGLGDDNDDLTAQDRNTLRGAILRVGLGAFGEPYTIPPGNPFGGSRGAAEVYAYGFHNPQSIDATQGRLWVTDRGAAFDEVNSVRSGENYGWPLLDANRCAPDVPCTPGQFAAPTANYPRAEQSCGLVGGAPYPMDGPLEELRGAFVYADGCDGLVRAVRVSSSGRITRDVLAAHAGEQIVDVQDGLRLVSETQTITLSLSPDAGASMFPVALDQAECFDLVDGVLQPRPDLVPYYVRSPLWSDGAHKRRWIVVPDGEQATIDDTGHLDFPPGSLIFKSFGFPTETGSLDVELRVMRRNSSTWSFFTYRLDEEGGGRVLEHKESATFDVISGEAPATLDYVFPDGASCRACHSSTRQVLALRTDQLAGELDYGAQRADQLETLIDLGMVEASQAEPIAEPDDEAATLDRRARAYLDANCGHCHRPGGWVPPDLTLDLRFSTPTADAKLCGTRMQYPSPFVPGDYRILPGDPENSALFQRMMTRGLGQMPILATTIIDPLAEQLIADWIRSLECDVEP